MKVVDMFDDVQKARTEEEHMSLACAECGDRLEGMVTVLVRGKQGRAKPAVTGDAADDNALRFTHTEHLHQWIPNAAQVLRDRAQKRSGAPAKPPARCAECDGVISKNDPGYIVGSGFCEGTIFSVPELSTDRPFVYVHARHIDAHVDKHVKKLARAKA